MRRIVGTNDRPPRRPALIPIALAMAALAAGCATAPASSEIRLTPDAPLAAGPGPVPAGPGALQRAVADARGPVRLVLAPGRYRLAPSPYTDPTCGNCADPAEPVPATVGLHVRGAGIRIEGAHPDSVVIETNAGYGILFDGCDGCALAGLTVTAGTRDGDGRATSGGVVVRSSRVALERCRIADNVGDSATVAAVVVGIAGVVGREGSDIAVRGCRIERNSWDGVALYRGARAEIVDNVIDGVDRASGARIGGGRGVGIGLTWDARATVERNRVTRYWKGIGVFVDARATVRHNVVEDILTWGLAYWGPGGGRPAADMVENAVYRTGACGASVERRAEGEPAPGRLAGNALARTGLETRYDSGEPYCPQRPIARTAVPDGFAIADNAVHAARQPGDWPVEPELDRPAFRAAVAPLLDRLARQPATAGSRFVRDYGTELAAGVIIVARHAEAERDAGDDPDLTNAGARRAQRLADVLADAGIDAILTTDYRRTRRTAAPLAAALGLEPRLYDARALDAAAERLARTGGRVLVLGHSNTNPELVRALGGEPGPPIDRDEHDRLYLLVLDPTAPEPVRTIVLRF